jgi:hypothetical protein
MLFKLDQIFRNILAGVYLVSAFAFPPAEALHSEIAMSDTSIPKVLKDAEVFIVKKFGCEVTERLYTIDDTFGDVLRFNCNNVFDISKVVIWSEDGLNFQFGTYPPEFGAIGESS